MKILVYGAGVHGSFLAHTLMKVKGNDVTILARGKRYDELVSNGIEIRHYFQRKETKERINVVRTLDQNDRYELIFVTMQAGQFESVLPILASNVSTNIVLSGNNAKAEEMQNFILNNRRVPKKIAFGMQTSAGMRTDSGKVISIHGKGSSMYGELNNQKTLFPLIKKAFGENYKVKYQKEIDSWLKTHYVYITAMNAMQYIYDDDLKKLSKSKQSLLEMTQATKEGFSVLEELGHTITPTSQAVMINNKWINYYFNKIYYKLPINKAVKGSPKEIKELLVAFHTLKKDATVHTPAWDKIEKEFFHKYSA